MPRAAVYIGDGRSAANLLGTEKFEKLAAKLADAAHPAQQLHSSAPAWIVNCPGRWRFRRGGTVILDSDALTGDGGGTPVGRGRRRDRAVADLRRLAGRDDRGLSQADAALAQRSRDGGDRDV